MLCAISLSGSAGRSLTEGGCTVVSAINDAELHSLTCRRGGPDGEGAILVNAVNRTVGLSSVAAATMPTHTVGTAAVSLRCHQIVNRHGVGGGGGSVQRYTKGTHAVPCFSPKS